MTCFLSQVSSGWMQSGQEEGWKPEEEEEEEEKGRREEGN